MSAEPAVQRALGHLRGLSLVEADLTLDDSRRVYMFARLDNRQALEVSTELGVSEAAAAIAGELLAHGSGAMGAILHEARCRIWRRYIAERSFTESLDDIEPDLDTAEPRH